MVCSVQSKEMNVITMATLFIPFTVSVQSSGSKLWFAEVLGGEQVSANRGKLRARSLSSWRWHFNAKGPYSRIQASIRGKRFLSPSQTFYVCIYWSLSQSFCLPIVVSVCSMASPTLLKMVCQIRRNRSGGVVVAAIVQKLAVLMTLNNLL